MNGQETVNTQKERLILLLETERRKTIEVLRAVSNDRAIVHYDSGWRVADMLGHLAMWEREVLAAIQAFHEGDTYSISNFDEERHNQAEYERRKTLDPAQIRMDWGMVRRDVQYAVHDLAAEKFDQEMTYPSGRRGYVIPLVEELAEHEAEHRAEIEQLIRDA